MRAASLALWAVALSALCLGARADDVDFASGNFEMELELKVADFTNLTSVTFNGTGADRFESLGLGDELREVASVIEYPIKIVALKSASPKMGTITLGLEGVLFTLQALALTQGQELSDAALDSLPKEAKIQVTCGSGDNSTDGVGIKVLGVDGMCQEVAVPAIQSNTPEFGFYLQMICGEETPEDFFVKRCELWSNTTGIDAELEGNECKAQTTDVISATAFLDGPSVSLLSSELRTYLSDVEDGIPEASVLVDTQVLEIDVPVFNLTVVESQPFLDALVKVVNDTAEAEKAQQEITSAPPNMILQLNNTVAIELNFDDVDDLDEDEAKEAVMICQ